MKKEGNRTRSVFEIFKHNFYAIYDLQFEKSFLS